MFSIWTFNTSDSEVLRAESRVANKPKIAAANVAGEDRANHQRSSWFLTCFRHRGDNSCNVDVQQFATVLSKKNTVLHYIAFLLFLPTVLPKSDFEYSSVNENKYRAAQLWLLSFSVLLASLESLGVVRSYAWLKSFPAGFGCVSSFLVAPSIEQRS